MISSNSDFRSLINNGNFLVVDVGGTFIKVYAKDLIDVIKIKSGLSMTPQKFIHELNENLSFSHYAGVSIGFPSPIIENRIIKEPTNLGYGWVNFDLESAFNCPVKIINDAAMQAIGSYDGGKMLFLGLGTGLGSTLVVNNEVISLELGHLNYLDHNYEYFTCDAYRKKNGNKVWENKVLNITDNFYQVFMPDYIVLGGGNVVRINNLPEYVRRGGNDKAFIGGMKIWSE
ncbi:ROK family protein [Providencia rettgeri]|uniref:ROK family protein n=1 Tax=Providencia TaxID=586 RepID=UPI001CFBE41F|nr:MULTISPECIES: ROK family protein [Providencia]MCB4815673.1 ROK family protein [Providencia rettgeri]MCG9944294.1 ROK family protein [Providencia rettgeri]MCJ2225494.1 ROK family protein [Providencia rettgeri]MCJ2288945.1 ROK family protein [Providencia rettgeri]MCK8633317.1 ROK family protein [Providencia rettgeri]